MRSLEIHKSTTPVDGKEYRIMLREYYGVEVDRSRICWLSANAALAVSLHDPALQFRNSGDVPSRTGVTPAALVIEKVENRAPRTLAWNLSIGGEHICRIGDGAVKTLQELASPQFPGGEPDWELRAIEDMEDKLDEKEGEVAALRDRISEKRQSWASKRPDADAAEPEMALP